MAQPIQPGDKVYISQRGSGPPSEEYYIQDANVVKAVNLRSGEVKYLELITPMEDRDDRYLARMNDRSRLGYSNVELMFSSGDPAKEIKKLLNQDVIDMLDFVRRSSVAQGGSQTFDYVDDDRYRYNTGKSSGVLVVLEINPSGQMDGARQFVANYNHESYAQTTNPLYIDDEGHLHVQRWAVGPTLNTLYNIGLKETLVDRRLPYIYTKRPQNQEQQAEWIIYYIPVSELANFLSIK